MKRSELDSTVFALLKEADLGVRIFSQDTRDPNYKGEYIEIIPLVFDEDSLFANSIVNVNVHIPDVSGIKNATRGNALSDLVSEVFRKSKDACSQYYTNFRNGQFSVESTHDLKEDNATHYRNFRIKVTYFNR